MINSLISLFIGVLDNVTSLRSNLNCKNINKTKSVFFKIIV